MIKKTISIVTPTYNEKENIKNLVEAISIQMEKLSDYAYEHIVIDNNSIDGTQEILKSLSKKYKNLKIIINSKNYGHIRSPFYAMLQAKGEAVVLMSSDFQDPVELINEYVLKWERGSKIILGKKNKSDEFFLLKSIRKFYYYFLKKISNSNLPTNTTGSGLYDNSIINIFKNLKEPYPYIRGLVSEFYDDIDYVTFHQPIRKKGKTKNNIFTMYDMGMLGVVKHSVLPLRFIIFLGFLSSLSSLLSGIIYLLYKLIYWSEFDVGVGPIVIGMFFLFSITILLIGIIGEYILVILNYTQNLPLVIEKERINFD